jgi:lysophospholipid acyltransferase (LPLAT)-like uncharacterized protein
MKKFLQSPQLRSAGARLLASYIRFVIWTSRWHVEGERETQALSDDAPLIIVFWHEMLPVMPVLFLRAKRMGVKRPGAILVSRHRDGQLIGQLIQNFGMGIISGSTSKGGPASLRSLLKALAAGENTGFAPDGPRGPRRTCAPGVAQMAAASGRLVVPCAALTSRAVTFHKAWDKMRFPLPFGRAALVCGPPIAVNREDWAASLPAITEALNAVADRAAAAL